MMIKRAPVCPSKAMEGPLHKENIHGDYLWHGESHGSLWITVGNISLYVTRNHEGLSVEMKPLGLEDQCSHWPQIHATFQEAQEEIDDPS